MRLNSVILKNNSLTKKLGTDSSSVYSVKVDDTGELSARDRGVMLRAIKYCMNIVSSFHETLGNDPDFIAACDKAKVKISNL